MLLKLRSKPGEHTTHIEEQPYQKLAERLPGGLPANFRLVYGHMGEVLDRTDLLVTVSSTAALESLHRAHPDRRPHRPGRARGARQPPLPRLRLPRLLGPARRRAPARSPTRSGSPGRACRRRARTSTAFDAARERVAELLGASADSPPLAPYYTPATAPGYLPGILARHHLGPDGSPLPGAAAAADDRRTRDRAAVRDAVRDAARGAYRHGVQRVAPVIRRMGEL